MEDGISRYAHRKKKVPKSTPYTKIPKISRNSQGFRTIWSKTVNYSVDKIDCIWFVFVFRWINSCCLGNYFAESIFFLLLLFFISFCFILLARPFVRLFIVHPFYTELTIYFFPSLFWLRWFEFLGFRLKNIAKPYPTCNTKRIRQIGYYTL